MICLDGNNSLRQFAHIGECAIADNRSFFDSDYYLMPEFVDRFKDEVSRGKDPSSGRPECSTSANDVNGRADGAVSCGENWKAAKESKTWGVFKESGLFAGACRHGLILWIADMIQSGEL